MTIISQIIGGIGNQMFQYAFGKYIAKQTNSELLLDIDGLGRPTFGGYQKRNFALSNLNIPNLKYTKSPFHKNQSTKRNIFDYGLFFIKNKIFNKYIYNEVKQEGFEYKSSYAEDINSKYATNINNKNLTNFLPYKFSTYLVGFWQSEKFREEVSQDIKNNFKLGYEIPQTAKDLMYEIKSTNSIAINVRRADFVQIGKIANVHDVCTTKYYQDSILYISEKFPDSRFFIFSDDMERCRQNLQFPSDPVFVEPSIYKGYEYELYMYIIGQCNHYIIPNSSFARWSVYLGRDNTKTVIIPNKRFNNDLNIKDLIPAKRNAIKIKV